MEQFLFGILAFIILGAGYGVVTARTVFVSALWLVLSFVGVAGIYVLLGAHFLAVTQILVYVGAISVLVLFAIMLTRDLMAEDSAQNRQWVLAMVIAGSVFGTLATVGYSTNWRLAWPAGAEGVAGAAPAEGAAAAVAEGPGVVELIGRSLMSEHLLAFEVISVVLLVALIGAIVIARD